MSLLNPNTSTVGGWLGAMLKSGYDSVVLGIPETLKFLAEGAANANHIERMGRTPVVSPSSTLGKFLADDQISLGEKILTLGRAPLDALNGVLKGDPEAVGSVLAGWATGKLVMESGGTVLPRNSLGGSGLKTSADSFGFEFQKIDGISTAPASSAVNRVGLRESLALDAGIPISLYISQPSPSRSARNVSAAA